MIDNLVIVESPTKAKTISKFLGAKYDIISCYGHVRDLKKKELSIDIKNNFMPQYVVEGNKKKVINQLKKKVSESKKIWLATDEDREGEAIAWHLFEILKLDENNTKRIVFHEITQSAILKAFENPRNINTDLVNAQQARRVLDRLVGYEISPVLWRKIKPALSAGRVQSVAVKLIVEREKEIETFKSKSKFKITADFFKNKNKFSANLSKTIEKEDDVKSFFNNCIGATYKIKNIKKSPAIRKPSPPFITSTLQQEASSVLGYSVARTMRLAQQLYEAGHITYMRTDSVNLSNFALKTVAKVINNDFGKAYLKSRKYTTKNKSAQEAHEAIRPTFVENVKVSDYTNLQRLYTLIRKKTIASQMTEAKIEKKVVNISISNQVDQFIASGETLIFDGFLKIYENKAAQVKDLLPHLKVGENLKLSKIEAKQTFTTHPQRYNEATLVKKLEDLGIGRPSTYAPTITNIQGKNYVEKKNSEGQSKNIKIIEFDGKNLKSREQGIKSGVQKGRLFPTDIGTIVTQFLDENFVSIMDYNFTAQAEKNFDQIAHGNKAWQKMISDFYSPFNENIEKRVSHI